MDLNILISDEGKVESRIKVLDKIKTAFKLGYNVVALNVRIDGSKLVNTEGKNKKKDGGNVIIPEPPDISIHDIDASFLMLAGKNPRILTRLTAIVSDSLEANLLSKSPVTKKYDLLSYEVTTLKIFQDACTKLEFDILSFDMAQKVPFQVKRPLLQMSARRGIFVEIQYAPAIKDKMARRNVIHSSHFLLRCTHKKNFIITSGASNVMHLRGPYDVANLGLLFGLDSDASKKAVTRNCNSVISHAASRKMLKGVIEVHAIKDVPEHDLWMVKEAQISDDDSVEDNDESENELSEDGSSTSQDEPASKKIKT